MEKLKKYKGITLIALVISIIVLLILAGVTINIALGENGLFNQTKLAIEKYKDAQNKEEQELGLNLMSLLGNVEVRDGEYTLTSEQWSSLQTTLDNLNTRLTNAESALNNKADATALSSYATSTDLSTLQTRVATHETQSNDTTNYSTSESLTNETWMGKPVYTKTIYVASLPNATTGTYNHGISDVEFIWFDVAHCIWIFSNVTYPLPIINVDGNVNGNIGLVSANSTSFTIITRMDRTSTSAYVTLKYTKTNSN